MLVHRNVGNSVAVSSYGNGHSLTFVPNHLGMRFFNIPEEEYLTYSPEVRLFLSIAHAVQNFVPGVKGSSSDKEFHFQKWVEMRLRAAGLAYHSIGRNSYPDFILDDFAVGFEVKGNEYPGRGAWDMNSKIPLAQHKGSKVFYVFGRYSPDADGQTILRDVVLCTATFLNAATEDGNENDSIWGAGSYGDILIRDRRMYVAYAPYSLTTGTDGHTTLILDEPANNVPQILKKVGDLERTESQEIITSYSFDLTANLLKGVKVPNPNAGKVHRFAAYKIGLEAETHVTSVVPVTPKRR